MQPQPCKAAVAVWCGLLVVTLAGSERPAPAASPFPEFLRSRFNPRMLQTNERRPTLLLPVPGGERWTEPLHRPSPTAVTPVPAGAGDSITDGASRVLPDEDAMECGTLEDGEAFPWIAVLEHGNPDLPGSRKRTLSKGVLIDRRYVLTTISSVQNSYPSWVLTGVRLGDAPTHRESASFPGSGRRFGTAGNGNGNGNGTLLRLPIGMVFLHDSKDIALIQLAGGGVREFTAHVRPVCMPREDHRLEGLKLVSHVCEKRERDGTRQGSHSKLQPVELVASEDCNRLLEPYGARLAGKSFCAWEDALDNCTGPLGGPVVANIHGKYHVVGLRSYLQTETEVDDGSELPSIYIRIGGFRKWMAAVIKAMPD